VSYTHGGKAPFTSCHASAGASASLLLPDTTMSRATTELQPTRFDFTLRFDQGYRYLDRCGEAIIRLESTLDPGWIPGEVSPTGGQLRNFTLGLGANFNVASMNVNQSEFLSFPHFMDQTCKIFEVLRSTFEVKRVLTPVVRVICQIGFSELADAQSQLRSLRLSRLDPNFLKEFGGKEDALDFTLTTYEDATWEGGTARRRRRIDVKVIQQERLPYFDERIMHRLPLVPKRYHEAIRGIRELRSSTVTTISVGGTFVVAKVYVRCDDRCRQACCAPAIARIRGESELAYRSRRHRAESGRIAGGLVAL